jgi:GxxExxY protein
MNKPRANQLSRVILEAALEVHRELGPGLLESTYETCLCYELEARDISYQRQVSMPVRHKGLLLDASYRLDVVVEDLVIVELKAVEALEAIHEAQLITYLRLSKRWLGLLINFNVPLLKQGIKRLVN